MITKYYSTDSSVQQESWVESYERRLKVVREKIYVYLGEEYKDTFDVTENIVRLSQDSQGLQLAYEYATVEAEMEKHYNVQQEEIEKSKKATQDLKDDIENADKEFNAEFSIPDMKQVVKEKDICEDFNVESLPSVMRKYIEDICKTTEAHPIMVASSVLTMLSGFMGTRVFLPEGVYYQNLYPNLWMLNITKSGSFKSSALSKGSKIAYDYSQEVSLKVKDYYERIKLEIDPKRKQELHNEMVKVSRRNPILPNKITPEALLALLDQGHGGTIMSNEFGGWLANLENSQNGDLKALFTELYDGYPYRYYTKSQGDFIISKPCFSINGVSNLPWIRDKIKPTDVESGFFARFLLYTPKFSTIVPEGLPDAMGKTTEKFLDESGIKNVLKEIRSRHDVYGDIKLDIDIDAREFFLKECHKEMYRMIWEERPHLKEKLTPYLKRWSPYVLKIATIMQMVENPRATHIGVAAMKAARSIVWPAIMSTIDLFENHLGMSDHQDKCLKVYKFINDKFAVTEKPMTRQAICASETLTGGSKEYTEVLTTLVDEGKLIYRAGISVNLSTYVPANVPSRYNALPTENHPISEEEERKYINRDYEMLKSLKNMV